jgi:uncharacterized protein YdeI (YjbR/CyaY-like superfamily)
MVREALRVERRSSTDLKTLDVEAAAEWRSWLRKNHLNSEAIWLVFHRKTHAKLSISYYDAIDEALAYGWIDSIIRKLDEQSYARKFTPRRPGSIWSRSNIERVKRLRREGRMTK